MFLQKVRVHCIICFSNPIKTLPKELGLLKNCGLLKMKSVTLKSLPDNIAKLYSGWFLQIYLR